MERVYSEWDDDSLVLPRNYLRDEQTRNLRAGIGEELWEALERIEERQGYDPQTDGTLDD
jgi:hypothetical protein